ncbi:MAG: WcaI family glycosyltransferase [Alphaproteobacteria bacterium]|nr:WcaI family glycosyltransferase [Alphaproteobacteria bacterium]MBU1551057.1 WcaI family glycosyltransferase [Alphaproteobacteria bacterium]MBU2335074.1 WcaI family glycosyltransferase [Alphaproteobacteria bacterium]MBU2388736.1 WcaI family glycosyltransferase [Alphaproteobacteria bacterium]
MKILIVGLNYAPEKIGIAVYTHGLAKAMAAAGHQVTIVCAQPYYPAWKLMPGARQAYQRSVEDGVTVIRCPLYVPARPSSARRILHHLSFALSCLFPVLKAAIGGRPDVVFCIAPSLIAAPCGRLAAFLSGARSWLHIQDFEVEAAFATNLLSDKGVISRLAMKFESTVLRSFDRASSISPQMCKHLISKGVPGERVVEFRNSGDLSKVRPLTEPSPYRAEWDIKTEHVALYSGNIANKQGIEILVDAARRLVHRQDLTIVVCGEGPNRAALETRAEGLPNIQFRDLQPRERINDLVGLATVHLLPQLGTAADLLLPSKLINMLASGRPVIATAAPGTGLAQEVEGCGLVTEPDDVASFAAAIEVMLDNPDLRDRYGRAARACAEERWSEKMIVERLMQELHDLVERGRAAKPAEMSALKRIRRAPR